MTLLRYTALFLLLALVLSEAQAGLYKTKAGLRLRYSDPVVSKETFKSIPPLNDNFATKLTGGINCIVKDGYHYDGYESGSASHENVYPAFRSYYDNGVNITLLSTVYIRKGVGASNADTAPTRGFGILSTSEAVGNDPLPIPGYPPLEVLETHSFKAELYPITNGVYSQTPVVYELWRLSPADFFNRTLGYANHVLISKDELYVVFVYGTGINLYAAQTQRFIAVARVLDDLSIEPIAKAVLPKLGGQGHSEFSISGKMWRRKDSSKYTIVLGLGNYRIDNPLGVDSAVASFTFDEAEASLSFTDLQVVPQYLESIDIHIPSGFIAVGLEAFSNGTPSVLRNNMAPWNNDAVDRISNLQFFTVDDEGLLEYSGGEVTDQWVIQVAFEDSGKFFAAVFASDIANQVFINPVSFLGPTRRPSPNHVQLFERIDGNKLIPGEVKGISSLSFGLCFDGDKHLNTVGQATYSFFESPPGSGRFVETGQNAKSVFAIEKKN